MRLDGCDSSEDVSAPAAGATGSDGRRGVEGRSSPSDSDPPPPGPSSAYSRIRETLQRRRQQIEAQLVEMDRRHQQYGRRLEREAELAEEAGSDSDSEETCRGSDAQSSSQRRPTATTGTGSQQRTVSSQETSTQTSARTSTRTSGRTSARTSTRTSGRRRSDRGSPCEPSSTGASVQVYTRRSRVPGSDTGTQTVSAGPDPAAGAVQVFTRRTRVPPPPDPVVQTSRTVTRRRPVSSGPRSAGGGGSGGSRRRRSAGSSPRRTVTVTRRPVSRDAPRRTGSPPPPPRRAHRAVQTATGSPERTVTVTRRRVVPEPGPASPPRTGTAVQTVTRRRRVADRRTETAAAAAAGAGAGHRPPSASRREVTVRRRPVADGVSVDTETVSTTADTTANTTANTTPTTVRSSVSNEEGMRDALEPSDRSGRRGVEDLERAERLLDAVGASVTASHRGKENGCPYRPRQPGTEVRSKDSV